MNQVKLVARIVVQALELRGISPLFFQRIKFYTQPASEGGKQCQLVHGVVVLVKYDVTGAI
jgi:hypothetical protein